jgi:RNA polymerase sigma-70 factor (ECF subfamily)
MLLTSHQRRLMGYMQALVVNRSDAEELLQETNLQICRHADEFQPGTDFSAWALRIAHFRVLEWRKYRSRDRLVFDDSLLERVAIAAQSGDTKIDRRQQALDGCLEKLTPHERQMVTQFYGDLNSTPQGLADRIGRSLKSLYVSVHRIRARLFDCVQRTLTAEDRIS